MGNTDPRNKYNNIDIPMQEQAFPGLQSDLKPSIDCGETSYEGSRKLKGYKMLVTGGDSAIGRAAAIAYAKEGADVAINYLESEESDAQNVKKIIESSGRKAVLLPGNIRDEDFNYKMVEEAYRLLGGLDNITLVAGRQQHRRDIQKFHTDSIVATFETNVFPIFWTIKKAIDYMSPGSTIITTTSEQGYNPSPISHDYSATKAAIISLTKSLSEELLEKSIRVNGVAPGPFWSPLQVSGGQPQSEIPDFGKGTLMGRPGQPVELSALYVLLASEDSSYTTGLIYGSTGGTQLN